MKKCSLAYLAIICVSCIVSCSIIKPTYPKQRSSTQVNVPLDSIIITSLGLSEQLGNSTFVLIPELSSYLVFKKDTSVLKMVRDSLNKYLAVKLTVTKIDVFTLYNRSELSGMENTIQEKITALEKFKTLHVSKIEGDGENKKTAIYINKP